MKLEYGMILKDQWGVPHIVSKYWEKDTDPMSWKVYKVNVISQWTQKTYSFLATELIFLISIGTFKS